jgi:hypothetical protein
LVAIDARIKALAERVIAEGKNKRAVAALKAMLKNGSVSTDDLNDLGYIHPPRAIGDVRDAGIPIITGSATSPRTGKRMAVYSFGDPSHIQEGRVGGRSALPKAFKQALLVRYGSVDCITGAKLDERVLQIDHRIPYRVAGDAGLEDRNVESYMLLDASSQRAKSWSCEHCPNMVERIVKVCETCFWAHPEAYEHIATKHIRRTDIAWEGPDVAVHDRLKAEAEQRGSTIAETLREMARQKAKEG